MESEWRTFKLSERCSVKSSKRIFASEYVARGVPFMRSKDVIDKSLGSFKSYDLFISDKRYQEIRNAHGSPQQGDLLINSVGNRSGQPYVVRSEGDFYFKDGNILWLHNFREIDANFLSYWFKSDLGQWTLESVMIGSAQKALTIDAIRNLELSFPSLQVQQAIAHILGSLDDKIELNRQMNETLEGMAQALFKSWFVDFDPVIDNALAAGNPIPEELADRAEVRRAALANGTANREAANPFPARFQHTEELGWIPVGWEVKAIADVTQAVTKGDTPLQSAIDAASKDEPLVNFLRVNAITEDGIILRDKITKIPQSIHFGKSKRSILKEGYILYTNAGTIGRVALVRKNILPANTNQAIAIVQPDESKISPSFLYMVVRQRGFQDVLHCDITQAVQANLALGKIAQSMFVMPSAKALSVMEQTISRWLERIWANRDEIESLTQLRDTLLPKLISGELRIPDAEKLAEAALE